MVSYTKKPSMILTNEEVRELIAGAKDFLLEEMLLSELESHGGDAETGMEAQNDAGRGAAPCGPTACKCGKGRMMCKRVVKKVVVAVVVFILGMATAVAVWGCNTVAGIGSDIKGMADGSVEQYNVDRGYNQGK